MLTTANYLINSISTHWHTYSEVRRNVKRRTYFKLLLFLSMTRVVTFDVTTASLDITAQSVSLTAATRTSHLHFDLAWPWVTGAWCRMADCSTSVTATQLTFTHKQLIHSISHHKSQDTVTAPINFTNRQIMIIHWILDSNCRIGFFTKINYSLYRYWSTTASKLTTQDWVAVKTVQQ